MNIRERAEDLIKEKYFDNVTVTVIRDLLAENEASDFIIKTTQNICSELKAEKERLEKLQSHQCKTCNGIGSVGTPTLDGWVDSDCPHCVGTIKTEAIRQTAEGCIKAIEDGFSPFVTAEAIRAKYLKEEGQNGNNG